MARREPRIVSSTEPGPISAEPSTRVVSTAGLHQGATAVVRGGLFSIGKSRKADVVLHDPGVQPLHLLVRRIGRDVEIVALGSPVELADGRIIEPEKSATLSLPVNLSLGDCDLRLEEAGPIAPSARWDMKLPQPSGFLTGTVVLVALAGVAVAAWPVIHPMLEARLSALGEWVQAPVEPEPAKQQAQGKQNPPAPLQPGKRQPALAPATGKTAMSPPVKSPPAVPSTNTAPSPSLPPAARALEEKFEPAGLKGKIELKPHGQAIVVRGVLAPDDYQKWRQIKAEMLASGQLSQQSTVDLVAIGSNPGPAASMIGAVVLAPEKAVIRSDGKKVQIGESLGDDWLIRDIAEDHVDIERGSQRRRVTF